MTKTDLVNYIKARIFTNGTKAITGAKHQEALLAVIDQFDIKQNTLERTVGGNDNATGTVTDTGSNLSVPIPVTTMAGASNATQLAAGTNSLRIVVQRILDNLANLFSTKANLASPALTGTPTAPTAAAGTNTTQIATTAFIQSATSKGNIYTVTSGTTGHLVKTNISNTETGQLDIHFRGGLYTSVGIIDTVIKASINNGVITESTLQQLNRGTGIGAVAAFIDTDNTWSFFFPHNFRYVRVDCEVTLKTSTGATTASAYINISLQNRCTSIAHKTTNKPTGNETSYIRVSDTQMFSVNLTKSRTIYVATEDGDDSDMGASRTTSVKTVAKAMSLSSHSGRVLLYINKYKTAAPTAYSSSTAYAVGDRCTSAGYAFERVTAGTGTTPSVTATVWKFVPLDSTTKGAYNASTAYAVGDTVTNPASSGSQILTYVCIRATTGNAPANASNRYWALCGLYNPVIPATTINYCNGLQIATENTTYNAAQPRVIVTGNLNLASNTDLNAVTSFDIGGTLTVDKQSFYFAGIINAYAITASYCSVGIFNVGVNVFSATTCTTANVVFYGAVVVNTSGLTTNGVAITACSNVKFYAALTVNGFNDSVTANTGIGLYFHALSDVEIYNTVIVDGFGTAVSVLTGGTYRNNSASTTLRKGTNTVPAGNTTAFNIDTGGSVINHARAIITRTNTIDSITSAGQLMTQGLSNLNRTVSGNDNATGTITDTGGNLSVPIPVTTTAGASNATQLAAGTNSLRVVVQRILDNLANLFSTKANLASPALTGTPTAPTAAAGTNTTQVATTAFVQTAIPKVDLASTTEQLTGELFNGKPVYLRVIAGSISTVSGASVGVNHGITGFTAIWVDVSNSFTYVYSDTKKQPLIITPENLAITGAYNNRGFVTFQTTATGFSLTDAGTISETVYYNIAFKYTK